LRILPLSERVLFSMTVTPYFLEAGVPGLDRPPGELTGMPILVGEGHLTDGLDARLDGVAWGHVNGAQDAHFQIRGWISHESDPVFFGSSCGSERRVDGGHGRAGPVGAEWPFAVVGGGAPGPSREGAREFGRSPLRAGPGLEVKNRRAGDRPRSALRAQRAQPINAHWKAS